MYFATGGRVLVNETRAGRYHPFAYFNRKNNLYCAAVRRAKEPFFSGPKISVLLVVYGLVSFKVERRKKMCMQIKKHISLRLSKCYIGV